MARILRTTIALGMTQADDDRDLYIRALDEQRLRSQDAERLIGAGPSYPNLESAALQLRFMLELIPLGASSRIGTGSSPSHRHSLEKIRSGPGSS